MGLQVKQRIKLKVKLGVSNPLGMSEVDLWIFTHIKYLTHIYLKVGQIKIAS